MAHEVQGHPTVYKFRVRVSVDAFEGVHAWPGVSDPEPSQTNAVGTKYSALAGPVLGRGGYILSCAGRRGGR